MNNLKLKYLQLIASFMITLIITIPIYSASVFAGLGYISAKGSDGINNYIKEEDYADFEVIASIEGDEEINASQVLLGTYEFDNCEEDFYGDYECTLRWPSSGTYSWTPGLIPYTIDLKDDAGSVVDTGSDYLYVDNLPPQISSFSVEPNLISEGDIKFEYTVEDEACYDASCSGKCSGIKNLELYRLDGSYSGSLVINSSDCSYSSESLKDSAIFGSGDHTIYARVYDRLGQVSDAVSVTFTVDNEAPRIDPNSFKITDESGLDMEYASPEPVPVIVYIEIVGNDLDKETVISNFTSINADYYNLEADCSETIDSLTECTWSINLAISEETTKEFIIEARDIAGNKEKVSLAKSFSIDTTGPVVTSIKTDRVKDSKSYAKLTNNTFIVELEEDVGLNPDQIILYLDSRGIKATNCSEGWTCYWYNVDLSGEGITKASIKDDTTDRLGNKAEPFTENITVDTNKPVLKNLSITNIGGATGVMTNYTKTGDKLQIVAIVEDEAIETAYLDLSSIITDAKKVVADSCVNINNSKWQCSWVTPSIDISGYIENYIYLSFEDVAGNVLQHQEAIKVYGLTDDAVVNYWTHEVECSPELIDRQTTSLINQKVFCHVDLEPLQENVMTLSIGLGECTNDTTAIQSAELFNKDIGSRDPYIKFVLKKSNFNVTEVNLNCPLYIISKVGNKITSAAEEENIAVKLEFYNMPLGELSEGVENKIKEAVEDATENYLELATKLRKWLFYAERICHMLNIWHNIVAAYQLLTNALDVAAKSSPYAYAVLNPTRVGQCIGTESVKKTATDKEGMLDSLCKFVNCELTFDKKGKYTGILYKWQEFWMGEEEGGRRSGGVMGTYGGGDFVDKWTGKDITSYMNPKDSMVLALLTACLPGILYNLDKWRQIQCMYALCLQEGVKQQGLPVMACEDQKSYAECKYITGEIFRIFPITAIFDYYMNKIRDVLSNPFRIIGAAAALGCATLCTGPEEKHALCIGVKIASLVGQSIDDITTIIDEGVFKIRDDYCDKLEEIEE